MLIGHSSLSLVEICLEHEFQQHQEAFNRPKGTLLMDCTVFLWPFSKYLHSPLHECLCNTKT